MRTKGLFDMPRPSLLRMQLHRLEVRNILRIEEHVPHRRGLLVHLERMTREDSTFGDNSSGVWVKESTSGDESRGLDVFSFLQEDRWERAKDHGGVDSGDVSAAVSEVALEFVYVIGAGAATASVLTVDGLYLETARADAHDERVLRADGAIEFGIALQRKVDDSHFVLVLQHRKDGEGTGWYDGLGDILEVNGNACAGLNDRNIFFCTPPDVALGALVVFELEYPRIVTGQVLVRIPRARPKRAHPTETLESCTCSNLLRRVHLIRELEVILLLSLSLPPRIESA